MTPPECEHENTDPSIETKDEHFKQPKQSPAKRGGIHTRLKNNQGPYQMGLNLAIAKTQNTHFLFLFSYPLSKVFSPPITKRVYTVREIGARGVGIAGNTFLHDDSCKESKDHCNEHNRP